MFVMVMNQSKNINQIASLQPLVGYSNAERRTLAMRNKCLVLKIKRNASKSVGIIT